MRKRLLGTLKVGRMSVEPRLAPVELFPVRIAGGPLPGTQKQHYAVSPDGQRFLINMPAGETEVSPINLILNWHT